MGDRDPRCAGNARVEPYAQDIVDHGTPLLAGVDSVLRVLASVPGRRDEALAAVNGLVGDLLAARGSRLAIPMTVRSGSEVLPLDRDGLAGALPQATGRVVVLVHGLMSTEWVWGFAGDRSTTYGTLLAAERGVTPVSVRYNSGRHISENGRDLARLLHRLVASWPVPVREITLIGHSMGGLVIRSACHYAPATRPRRGVARFRRSWTSKVRRVVLVGVPNTGAPLEVLANLTSAALWALPIPVTRLVGLGLDARSDGIKDLRFGAILDDDWLEQDPDARSRPLPHQVNVVRGARYLTLTGSLTTDPDHPVARLIGDALVTSSSASGTFDDTAAGLLFPDAAVRHFPKVNHIALANRPEIYDAIDEWWDEH